MLRINGRASIRLALLLTVVFIISATVAAQQLDSPQPKDASAAEQRDALKNYRAVNGTLNLKGILFGGMFRVTTVVPFKGNFADYHHLEIVRPVSLVGKALNPTLVSTQAARLKAQFEERRLFQSVEVIDHYDSALANPRRAQSNDAQAEVESAESLDAPIGGLEDMLKRDRQRAVGDQSMPQPTLDKTLVVVIEVLDYAKDSRWKLALPLDIGRDMLTVRLRYYDKNTGVEVGRQIISGESNGSSLLGPFELRDGLSGVVDGLVDQLTRRVAAAEK